MGKNRIVIIDDEPVIRMDFREMLTLNGYEVAGEAADGFDAVELCRREKPDLVIMDIKMSVFDGLSAAEIILSEELSDCIILVSAYNDKEFFKKAKHAGVMNYLIKPVREKVSYSRSGNGSCKESGDKNHEKQNGKNGRTN